MSRIFFFNIFICFFISLHWFVFAESLDKDLSLKKTIVILGDSLTEGYGVSQQAAFPSLIQEKINQDKLAWNVVGAGSSGSTSASSLSRLKWISKQKPDVVLIFMGSNDGLRGLKTEETQKNLDVAIKWAKENRIQVILGQLEAPPNYGKEYARKFSEIYPALAKSNQIKLAPFLLNQVAGKPNLNQADGIHPNEKGHKIIAENIYKFLLKEVIKK